MELYTQIESALAELGYELVDVEQSVRGKLLRIFVDKQGGITVDDCVVVSNHLERLLMAENVNYDQLEVSSPGLDRCLKKETDFLRFRGELVKLKLRVALQGQRNFVGTLQETNNGILKLDVEGNILDIEIINLEKARLIPKL